MLINICAVSRLKRNFCQNAFNKWRNKQAQLTHIRLTHFLIHNFNFIFFLQWIMRSYLNIKSIF